jgi:hypothetical protein
LARRTEESASGLSGDWPTPLESDDHAKVRKRGNPNLPATVMWPSPRATDGAKGGPNQRGSKGDLMLPSAVRQWPTPTVDGNYNRKGASATSGDGLSTAVIQASARPTPTARDHRSIHASEATMVRNSRPLSEHVGHHAPESYNTNGRNRESLRLNHKWVAQLLGFPSDWLEGVEWPR